jgi:aspartate racemase
MATQAALGMRLYQDRLGALGWDCIVPSQDEMDQLVTPAIRLVKLNRMVEAYAPLAAVARSLAERGAGSIVLGCTEIPLGMQAGPQLEVQIVDTIDALARASIAWAKG